MSDHPDVSAYVTDVALAASPMLQRFYTAGGGSLGDLRTDLSCALAAAARAVNSVIDLLPFQERRVAQQPFAGLDRRRARISSGAS